MQALLPPPQGPSIIPPPCLRALPCLGSKQQTRSTALPGARTPVACGIAEHEPWKEAPGGLATGSRAREAVWSREERRYFKQRRCPLPAALFSSLPRSPLHHPALLPGLCSRGLPGSPGDGVNATTCMRGGTGGFQH